MWSGSKGRDNGAVPQSLADVVIHLVFSTKHRAPTLTAAIRTELCPYLGAILRSYHCTPLQIDGVEDHVHLLFKLSRTMTIAQVTERVKTGSAKWVKARWKMEFAWQSGYAAFSVGSGETGHVSAYIQNQEAHHQRMSFQDEFRTLLRESGVKFDEQYVWD